MATVNTSDNRYGVAQFIVAPTIAEGANYTTIQSAINAAVSGQTIFIRPGTYTENITLKAGVNLTSFSSEGMFSRLLAGSSANVVILGTTTCNYTGSCTLSGIELKTNGAVALDITGAGSSGLVLELCSIQAADATGITINNAACTLDCYGCLFSILLNNLLFACTSTSGCHFRYCDIRGSATSTTSTNASGNMKFTNCYMSAFNLTTTSSGAVEVYASYWDYGDNTLLTTSGTGTTSSTISNCFLNSESASTFSIGAGSILTISESTVRSSNANAITGAGSINYNGLSFTLSSNINTTTQDFRFEGPSRKIGSSNSGNTNTLLVTNTSNTATSSALINTQVAGTTAADPYYKAEISGGQAWTWGLDNSDSDAFTLSGNAALGTTNVMRVSIAGEINYPLQPAFLAYLNSSVADVTGDGTLYTIIYDTEVFDQNADFNLGTSTFTAPVTGRYQLDTAINLSGATNITSSNYRIVTSNRTYLVFSGATAAVSTYFQFSVLADMDSGDTATIAVQATDTGGKVDDAGGVSTGIRNWFSGSLCC